MGKENKQKDKLRRGHLDALPARVYFGNGRERLSRTMVTSDWQCNVFHTPPTIFFVFFFAFLPHFRCSQLPPFLPVRRLFYWLWQRHLNSISVWQRSWWCLTHSGCWDGKINHWLGGMGGGGGGAAAARGSEKENKAVLPAATWPPFPVWDFFFLSLLSTWEGNPWERGRGQTYLGKVSQGNVREKKNLEQLLVWSCKSVSTKQNDNSSLVLQLTINLLNILSTNQFFLFYFFIFYIFLFSPLSYIHKT